jgi:predicted transporter
MKQKLEEEVQELEYKPLDLSLVLKTAASIIGVSVKKVKMGRIVGNSELTSRIELIIEIFVKYCLENNSDNYSHTKIAETFNGYHTKVHVLMHRFIVKGISAKSQFYFNELCKQLRGNEKK